MFVREREREDRKSQCVSVSVCVCVCVQVQQSSRGKHEESLLVLVNLQETPLCRREDVSALTGKRL